MNTILLTTFSIHLSIILWAEPFLNYFVGSVMTSCVSLLQCLVLHNPPNSSSAVAKQRRLFYYRFSGELAQTYCKRAAQLLLVGRTKRERGGASTRNQLLTHSLLLLERLRLNEGAGLGWGRTDRQAGQ